MKYRADLPDMHFYKYHNGNIIKETITIMSSHDNSNSHDLTIDEVLSLDVDGINFILDADGTNKALEYIKKIKLRYNNLNKLL